MRFKESEHVLSGSTPDGEIFTTGLSPNGIVFVKDGFVAVQAGDDGVDVEWSESGG